MRHIFIPQVNQLRTPDELALLIFDGHKSHESMEMEKLAMENNIHLIRLPAHTTHKLQPLDVGLFGPMQSAWRKQCKDYTTRTQGSMPLSQVVKEYMTTRRRVMKASNIKSAWEKSGILDLDPNYFSPADYGPAQLTSINAFLPASYPRKVADNCDVESDSADSTENDSWRPTGSSDHDTESPSVLDGRARASADASADATTSTDDTDIEMTDLSSHPTASSSRLHTPPPSTRPTVKRKPGSTLSETPNVSPTPRRPRSRGFLHSLPPAPPRKDRRFADQRSIDQKYWDTLQENERLRNENQAYRENEAKILLLLEAAETHCNLANQHLATIQAQHNAKKTGKGKRGNTRAEWLTSETYQAAKEKERAENEAKEREAKAQKEKKEAQDRERQQARNQLSVTGEFKGVLTGKSKDDLKDVAQALGLKLDGKNQELVDRINKYLDQHPELERDKRFHGLFVARTKSKSAGKRKQLATSEAGQANGTDTAPASQRARLE